MFLTFRKNYMTILRTVLPSLNIAELEQIKYRTNYENWKIKKPNSWFDWFLFDENICIKWIKLSKYRANKLSVSNLVENNKIKSFKTFRLVFSAFHDGSLYRRQSIDLLCKLFSQIITIFAKTSIIDVSHPVFTCSKLTI